MLYKLYVLTYIPFNEILKGKVLVVLEVLSTVSEVLSMVSEVCWS